MRESSAGGKRHTQVWSLIDLTSPEDTENKSQIIKPSLWKETKTREGASDSDNSQAPEDFLQESENKVLESLPPQKNAE